MPFTRVLSGSRIENPPGSDSFFTGQRNGTPVLVFRQSTLAYNYLTDLRTGTCEDTLASRELGGQGVPLSLPASLVERGRS